VLLAYRPAQLPIHATLSRLAQAQRLGVACSGEEPFRPARRPAPRERVSGSPQKSPSTAGEATVCLGLPARQTTALPVVT